ncbi:PAS domain-containing protein [Mucilaginibacter sp.]|uniref:PAS domain-containing protein n=1 Tax=Mucilaginibacter sp. TaxID=1882438 RepID=UPI0035BC4B8F
MDEQAELLTLLGKLRKSEDQYRQLIEQASDAIYVLSPDGRFTNVNGSMCNLLGYDRSELLTMNIVDIVDPEQLKVDPLKYVSPSDPVTSTIRERRFVRKDGLIFDVEINVKTFPNDRVMVIARDITERKSAEKQIQKERELLLKSEANLQTILNNTDTAFALLSTRLEIIEYNNLALEYAQKEFNYTPDMGNNLLAHLPKERINKFNNYIKTVLSGEPVSYEINYPEQTGENSWYFVRMFPIADKGENILGIILAATNITERKHSEQKLQLAYKHISQHVASIREMTWKQSHLIRSPIANLKALTALLKADPTCAVTFEHIESELDRLDKIIVDMSNEASERTVMN